MTNDPFAAGRASVTGYLMPEPIRNTHVHRSALSLIAVAIWALPAYADVRATFTESAPKDRFEITNDGTCALQGVSVTLDLSTSAAGLIFDVTSSGAGVEVFQPFQLITGGALVANPPQLRDGMNEVTLDIPNFPAGASIVFTIDVDDTRVQSDLGQIRVSGSEIEGAYLRVNDQQDSFSNRGRARVATSACNA
ncbi:MAG: aggregation factor core [Paracoccaceae bacterium]